MRHRNEQRKWPLSAAAALLCAAMAIAIVTTASASPAPSNVLSESASELNCPDDCVCNVAQNTHTPLLHAKCQSVRGLAAPWPRGRPAPAYPLHSVDLSYLHLTNLSHALAQWPSVTALDLSHNDLHAVGHLGRRIKKLNLRHNRLASDKLLKLPENVQVLNLQHNDITTLPRALTQLRHLRALELGHNAIECSCETLAVRNWLKARGVAMEGAVECAAPAQVRGVPWQQVSQAEICERERARGAAADAGDEDGENELMLGDQPIEGSGDADQGDELGKDYIPIGGGSTAGPHLADLVEGSGDLGGTHLPLAVSDEPDTLVAENDADADDGEEGSGSGFDELIIPMVQRVNEHLQEYGTSTTEAQPPVFLGNGMGIFDDDGDDDQAGKKDANDDLITAGGGGGGGDGDGEQEQPATSAAPVPPAEGGSASTEGPSGDAATEGLAKASVRKAPADDTNATYYLLGVIILIVVGLILFVGIKRCKHNAAAHDVENPRQTELLDMDRKNPGKPLRYNGLEHAPLIGDKAKADLAKPINGAGKKPYDGADANDGGAAAAQQQQPLLNGSDAKQAPVGGGDHQQQLQQQPPPHEYYPITPRYPTPKSPRASKYAQYPQNSEANNNNNNNNNDNNNDNNNVSDQYLPSSPKSGRYSPVYSPETGRVKIKLTETPRPKTPMLVTRTKSNAGDIITTPVRMGTFTANNNNNNNNNNLEVPAVHGQALAVGGADNVNGHVQH